MLLHRSDDDRCRQVLLYRNCLVLVVVGGQYSLRYLLEVTEYGNHSKLNKIKICRVLCNIFYSAVFFACGACDN